MWMMFQEKISIGTSLHGKMNINNKQRCVGAGKAQLLSGDMILKLFSGGLRLNPKKHTQKTAHANASLP